MDRDAALDKKYRLNTLVIKKPTGTSKPYGIFYNGISISTILAAMKMIEDNDDDMRSYLSKEIYEAVEDIKIKATWNIAIEGTNGSSQK